MSTGSKLYIHFLQIQMTLKYSWIVTIFLYGAMNYSWEIPQKVKKPKQTKFYFPLTIYNT